MSDRQLLIKTKLDRCTWEYRLAWFAASERRTSADQRKPL